MANIAAKNILTRAREVIDTAAGTLRTISASRFSGSLDESSVDDEHANASVEDPRFDVSISGISRHPSSPPMISNTVLYNVDVTVTIVRYLGGMESIDDDTRDTAKANAIVDGDMLCQALMFPGNMTQTAAGAATGLASGLLSHVDTTAEVVTATESVPTHVKSKHTFTGVAVVTMASS